MTTERKLSRRPLFFALAIVVAAVFLLPGASFYYHYSGGRSCARCHEIWQPYTDWHTSTHRNVACSACHGDVFTLDAGFHLKNIHRLAAHLRGDVPEQVRLKTDDVVRMGGRCRKCHQQEYADWSAGGHSATYTEIFLDKDHNRQRHLMDDCLRCHAMHFEGGIRDLVTPIDVKGPWKLRHPELAEQPAIPCLACHQMHRQGLPEARPAVKPVNPGGSQENFRPSLALFDRRELDFVPVGRLPLPAMREGDRPMKISPDQRQALCYQCHAPLANLEVGSGDDRTTIGIHEGLSCLACHQGHGQKTRASCANCHPHLSNCGLDVETMDTSFKSLQSPHNIHTVKCIDCHTKGVPKKKNLSL
jgi:hypothetical protein